MSRTTYQVTGHIIANSVSQVNVENDSSINITSCKESNKDRYKCKVKSHLRKCVNLSGMALWVFILIGLFSFLAFAYSLYTIICGYPRELSSNLTADSTGIIVTTLSILVTFVVAWQIWATITTKEEIKKATEAADKLDTLEIELNKQHTLFENQNLEIKHLIDAHARLHEAENEKDLSYKYILYAEAIILLIQSNMDMSYEQFRNAREGLLNTINDFQLHADIDEVEDFINSEREYERCYQILMSLSTKRSEEIDKFRQGLTRVRELRMDAIAAMKNSNVGKLIKRRADKLKKEMEDEEKRLREKKADRQASESKDSTED